jgi:elongation factor Ts
VSEQTQISAAEVSKLREATGAGMMDCKRALQETGGDFEQAVEVIRKKGLDRAKSRAGRVASEGVVQSYIHFNNRVGVLVEVNCETDFVANTDEFKQLAKDIALHIASARPRWLTREEISNDSLEAERRVYEAQAREQGKPENVLERIIEGKLGAFYKDNVLLDQDFVRDDSKTVGELADEVSAKVGEKVAIRRFARFELGEEIA